MEQQSGLGKIFAGVGIGFVLVVACVLFLFVNEQQSAQIYASATEAARTAVAVPAAQVDSANDGKLVCVSGNLSYTLKPMDDTFGVAADTYGIRRRVEMYQWKEKSETDKTGGQTQTTYSYELVWSDTAIDSSKYHEAGHSNPAMPYESKSFYSKDLLLGAFRVGAKDLDMLTAEKPVAKLTGAALPGGLQAQEGYLTNITGEPKVGDIRISFTCPTATQISVLAGQSGSVLVDYTAKSGAILNKAEEGIKTITQIVGDIRAENSANTWKLRGMLTGGLILGFLLIFGPLSALAGLVPFFGRFVGGMFVLVSLLLGGALSLITIAVSWIAVRPSFAYSILGVALVLLVLGLVIRNRKATA